MFFFPTKCDLIFNSKFLTEIYRNVAGLLFVLTQTLTIVNSGVLTDQLMNIRVVCLLYRLWPPSLQNDPSVPALDSVL